MKHEAMRAAVRNRRASSLDEAHILGNVDEMSEIPEEGSPMEEASETAKEEAQEDGSDLAPNAEDALMAHQGHDPRAEMARHSGHQLEQHEAEHKASIAPNDDSHSGSQSAINHPNGTAPKEGGHEAKIREALMRAGGSPTGLGQKVFKKIQSHK